MEHTFADFSGGMNSLAAVDKLDPKECLLAENVRLDETGNILSAGAATAQNSSLYKATGGSNVHSLYWNPSLGGVAGVGQDVFIGASLGSMASGLAAKNTIQQKMSFASAPNRVYFDVGNVGYWTDESNLLTVDWPSPIAVGATITGPTSLGTATQTPSGYFVNAWTGPNNITSTVAGTSASISMSNPVTQYLRATMSTNSFAVSTVAVTGIAFSFTVKSTPLYYGQFQITIMKSGTPVGTTRAYVPTADNAFQDVTFGGSTDLWEQTWTQADINAGTLGFQIVFLGANGAGSANAYNGKITIYQGSGFVAGTGAGGQLTGTYSYKVAFVAANGEESEASNASNTATLASQQGTLTAIQLGDNRTTSSNVYRKGGILTSYYLVGSIGDNLSTTYSDNQSDLAALAQGTILAGDVPGDYPNSRLGSQIVRFPVLHYDRVFWVNQTQKNELIWSKPLNGFAYPSINSIDVGDSKPISRIVSIYGELIIIKTDSIWRLTGTDESSFDLTQTPSAVGTDESFSVVALPDKIIFANRWGLWVFNGYTSQPLTPKLDLWFKQNDRTSKSLFGVNGFHPPEVVSTTVPLNFDAVGNSEKYVLAYAEAGQTANNAALVFDVKHGNITKRAGVAPLSLAIDPVTGFVYQGDSGGFISLLDDWNGANQKGSAANFDYQSPYIDLERGSNKSLWALEWYLNTNGQALTPSIYYDDGIASETLPAITANGLQRVVRPVQASLARKMQNFSWRLNGSLTSINVSGTPQVQIIHVKALYDIRTGRARTGQ